MINKIENFIFDKVKKNAGLKNILVKCYQCIFSLAGLRKGRFVTQLNSMIIEDAFFGFHDRPSMNSYKHVLGHSINECNTASIKVYDLNLNESNLIAKTQCWNNQQGSLLTWFDEENVIYNDFTDSPVTKIISKSGELRKVLPFHFFSVSPNHNYLTSINFLRFGVGLDGYGYEVKFPEEFNIDAKENISRNNISDLNIYLLKSFSDEPILIKNFKIIDLMKDAIGLLPDGYFYFSHTAFSPDSSKVFFLLRSSNAKQNTSQLYVYDIIEDNLLILPTGGMVSHLTWFGQNSVVAYCNIINGQDAYYKFELNIADITVERVVVANNERDGHPNAIDSTRFVTDTYPDRERRQHLYLVNPTSGTVQELLSIYSPLKFRGNDRVDLHPRFSLCGRYITIDTSHNNKRQQVVLELKD